MKKLSVLFSLFVFSSCSPINSSSSTTQNTVITTTAVIPPPTTISYGTECNRFFYDSWVNQTISLLKKARELQGGTNLLSSYNSGSLINYLSDLRSSIYFLDLPLLDKSGVIYAIDDYVEDVSYYYSYQGNPYSTAQVNNSSAIFWQEIDIFVREYGKLCASI